MKEKNPFLIALRDDGKEKRGQRRGNQPQGMYFPSLPRVETRTGGT